MLRNPQILQFLQSLLGCFDKELGSAKWLALCLIFKLSSLNTA
jgi:hypothetical protein